MRHGIFAMTRGELEGWASMAAARGAWETYKRLVAEISCRDRHDVRDVIQMELRA